MKFSFKLKFVRLRHLNCLVVRCIVCYKCFSRMFTNICRPTNKEIRDRDNFTALFYHSNVRNPIFQDLFLFSTHKIYAKRSSFRSKFGIVNGKTLRTFPIAFRCIKFDFLTLFSSQIVKRSETKSDFSQCHCHAK